jgi:hypothetical protein
VGRDRQGKLDGLGLFLLLSCGGTGHGAEDDKVW